MKPTKARHLADRREQRYERTLANLPLHRQRGYKRPGSMNRRKVNR